jgi:CRP-like cAMP-binding protein
MARSEFQRHLATVPFFATCSKKQLDEVGQVATVLNLHVGKELARQGDFGFEMFILLDGSASVTRDGTRIATLTAGDFVGELAVISGHRRNATVAAETEMQVLVLTHADLDRLLDDIPGLAKHLLYEVTPRLVAAAPNEP